MVYYEQHRITHSVSPRHVKLSAANILAVSIAPPSRERHLRYYIGQRKGSANDALAKPSAVTLPATWNNALRIAICFDQRVAHIKVSPGILNSQRIPTTLNRYRIHPLDTSGRTSSITGTRSRMLHVWYWPISTDCISKELKLIVSYTIMPLWSLLSYIPIQTHILPIDN